MKKVIIFFSFALLGCLVTSAQDAKGGKGNEPFMCELDEENAAFPPCTYKNAKGETVKNPGGDEGLKQYISDAISVSLLEKRMVCDGAQGRVIVTCTILEDGSVVDVKVKRGVDPLLDKEAVRIVSSMPKWKPAKIHDKPVKSRWYIPVVFRLP